MYSMMGRKCRGKYYDLNIHNYVEFERGIFLCFGINYEEIDGPAQYTTAIVELEDGKVIITTPDHIQFIHCHREDIQSALTAPVEAVDTPNDEIPSDTQKDSERESQELFRAPKDKPKQEAARKSRQRIDYGKIMALRKAGWNNEKIAGEMHMTKAAVATAISTYKKKRAEGGNS